MAPGLVSAGGHLPDPSKGDIPLDKGRAVAVMAQDKEVALSIGILKESTEEIRAKGKGVVVDNMHCLGGELQFLPSSKRCYWVTYFNLADDLWAACAKGGF